MPGNLQVGMAVVEDGAGTLGKPEDAGLLGVVRDDGPGHTRGEKALRDGQSMAKGLWVRQRSRQPFVVPSCLPPTLGMNPQDSRPKKTIL